MKKSQPITGRITRSLQKMLLFTLLFGLGSYATVTAQDLSANAGKSLIKPEKALSAARKAGVFREFFPLTEHDQMRPVKTEKDRLDFTHDRYQQLYKGLEVEGAVYTVHAKNDRVESLSGRFATIGNLPVNPSISEKKALERALSHVGAQEYVWENCQDADAGLPTGQLVVFPGHPSVNSKPRLAYKFDIYASSPLYRAYVFIDAHTGDYITAYDRICHGDVPATGHAIYQGNVSFTADQTGPTSFRLRQTASGNGIETYDMQNGTDYASAVDVTSAASHFTTDDVAVQAHYGAEEVYDYFFNEHGRNSYDGAGSKILSYVHYGVNFVNAFWDGSRMTYGDGDGVTTTALVALDVCGHEIAHAVTEHSANLIYQNESGALNESFSDIFGEAVEHHATGSNDWLIGSEFFPGGGAIRSMSNPNLYDNPDTYLGDHWYFGLGDNGGVHINSGVQNFWFYLLVTGGTGTNDHGYVYNVPAIGLDDAAAIAYRNLSVYLNPSSEYKDARTGAIQAAIDLFGAGSSEELAVIEAWNAVGVYDTPPPPPANDECVGAIPIGCGDVVAGTTIGATEDGLDPCGTYSMGKGVWYKWVADGSVMTLSVLCPATNYDARISVFEESCGSLECIGGSGNAYECFFPATFIFCSNVENTYHILVHGDGPAIGNFELSMVCTDPPTNDYVCDAQPVTLGVPAAANSACATAEYGEVNPGIGSGTNSCLAQDGWCADEPPSIQNSLWYTFVAPPSGSVDILTGDVPFGSTQLALWEVDDCSDFNSFTEIAANQVLYDYTLNTFVSYIKCAEVVPGETYYVQIDGENGQGYNTTITVTDGTAPINNDVCAATFMVLNFPYPANGMSICTNAQPGEVSPGAGTGYDSCTSQDGWCQEETAVHNSLWFKFVAPPTGEVDIYIDNDDDVQLALWYAADCNDFSTFIEIAANDDDEEGNTSAAYIEGACLAPGFTYYLQIDGYDGFPYNTNVTVEEVGNTLTFTCPPNVSVSCEDDTDPSATGEPSGTTNDCCSNPPGINSWDGYIDGNCYFNYTIVRNWTITWDCGYYNPATCIQYISVSDETGPMMTCNDLEVTANVDGTYVISQADLEAIGDGTYDNCGDITFSLSQTEFDCEDEIVNVLTLTATDECENSNSCSATVTVHPYLEIIACTTTDETCLGAGNGNIIIEATAPSGQIGYSIDGGANWQMTGDFYNLTPGTYDIIVQLFGEPEACEQYDLKTIYDGPAPQTWWLDNDEDGYHNGISLLTCDPPAGYSLEAQPGDCNDFDSSVHPYATEICDGLDNDCDGNIPAGEVDQDGDGYFVCDGDCNDNNAAIHPGATEICDGLDNNCDGTVDEGLSGETYTGNVIFNNQSQVNAWPACYSSISGNLIISGAGINNLAPLANLTEINGTLTIYFNSTLTSLNGLDGLVSVGGSLFLYYNFQLSNCCAIADMLADGGVAGAVVVFFNAGGSSCNSQAAIIANCVPAPLVAAPNQNTLTENNALQMDRSLHIFPNPAGQHVTLAFRREAAMAHLRITDLLGRTVYVQELSEGMNRINIDLGSEIFRNGVYLVSFSEAGKTWTERLVVQR